tara:strand:+ start:708 stop:1277 length:570 start_codon:yes stop_codon:yes gene_type:complete
MIKKNFMRALIIFFFFIVIFYFFFRNESKIEKPQVKKENLESSYSLNIIENVSYSSKDVNGNEYIIVAKKGEIDASDSNVIFLTKVNATIKLVDGDLVLISSDYGRYNTNNFDTIFSKSVIINYLENKIFGDYLDFSISRNTMIITKNVKYSNSKNTLFADVIEMDIKTKDTKIYMHEGLKKVNIKSKE